MAILKFLFFLGNLDFSTNISNISKNKRKTTKYRTFLKNKEKIRNRDIQKNKNIRAKKLFLNIMENISDTTNFIVI